MIIKIVFLFLVGMIILAIFGRLKLPKIRGKSSDRCEKCGRFLIGKSDCECQKKQD